MDSENKLYFHDPMLKLGMGTRMWARVAISVLNIISFVAGLVLVFSDIPLLLYLGVLLLILFTYNTFVAGFIWKRKDFKGGNISPFATSETKALLESAMNGSTLMGGSLLLYLTRELADTLEGTETLQRLGIPKDEFAGQAERYLAEEKHLKETKKWKLNRIEELMIKALTGQGEKRRPISPGDLFRALVYMDNEKLQRLFNIFGITQGVMERSYEHKLEHAG